MPSKKKKYNARFPAGRIKKIMQSDEEIGKVAQAVPVIISRTLELFVESLLTKTLKITNSRNAKTLSTSHMKQCIMAEQRFDFLRELVKNIPDISVAEEAAANNLEDDAPSSAEEQYPDSDTPYDLSMPSTSTRATTRSKLLLNGGSRADVNAQRPHSQNANGGSTNTDAQRAQWLKHESDMIQRLQRISGVSSSVITHTTAALSHVTSECLPAKLSRCDSTPANVTTSAEQHHNWTQARNATKNQTLSVPINNNNNSSNIINSKKAFTPPKQQQQPKTLINLQPTQQLNKQTAIPAPIVSFDFCNKPVVKIDYSNLPVTRDAGTTGATAPLSAPANMHTTTSATAFNFSAEPIISIDLSNIVASATSSFSTAGSSATTACVNGPAVATISIGGLCTQEPILPLSNSKASMAAPFKNNNNYNNNDAAPTKSVIPAASVNTKSFFELDEDYDNI